MRNHCTYVLIFFCRGSVRNHLRFVRNQCTVAIDVGSLSNDPGGSRSMFPISGELNLQELPDFSILLPQSLRTLYPINLF